MQLTHLTALLALSASAAAGTISRHSTSHADMLERSYVDGPVAFARAILALRHAATGSHAAAPAAAAAVDSRDEAYLAVLAEMDARAPVAEPVDEAIAAPRRKAPRKRAAEPEAAAQPEAHAEPEPEPEADADFDAEERFVYRERSSAGAAAIPRVWGYRRV